jgi:hypothetical protein
MKRRTAINPRRAKLHRNYNFADAARLLGVHRNTVRNWTKAGLETFRAGGEVLILGDTLRAFLEKRRKDRRQKLPPGHLFCLRCKAVRPPGLGMVELVQPRGGTANARAVCADCGALMHRKVSLAKLGQAGFAGAAPCAEVHT